MMTALLYRRSGRPRDTKNRINLVCECQTYANMWSFGTPEGKADTAMQHSLF
jgi:hypothetical protein